MRGSYFGNFNLVARVQVVVTGLVWECDTSPGKYERTRGPSEGARIEDCRNRDSRGYLRCREVLLRNSYSSETNFIQPLVVGGFRLLNSKRSQKCISWIRGSVNHFVFEYGSTHAPKRLCHRRPTLTSSFRGDVRRGLA